MNLFFKKKVLYNYYIFIGVKVRKNGNINLYD
jgi:hypothetical protein